MKTGEKYKGCIVVVNLADLWEVHVTYGPWVPVGMAYRLYGFARSYLYRLLEEGKLTKVVVDGKLCCLESELNNLKEKGK